MQAAAAIAALGLASTAQGKEVRLDDEGVVQELSARGERDDRFDYAGEAAPREWLEVRDKILDGEHRRTLCYHATLAGTLRGSTNSYHIRLPSNVGPDAPPKLLRQDGNPAEAGAGQIAGAIERIEPVPEATGVWRVVVKTMPSELASLRFTSSFNRGVSRMLSALRGAGLGAAKSRGEQLRAHLARYGVEASDSDELANARRLYALCYLLSRRSTGQSLVTMSAALGPQGMAQLAFAVQVASIVPGGPKRDPNGHWRRAGSAGLITSRTQEVEIHGHLRGTKPGEADVDFWRVSWAAGIGRSDLEITADRPSYVQFAKVPAEDSDRVEYLRVASTDGTRADYVIHARNAAAQGSERIVIWEVPTLTVGDRPD